MAGVAVLGFPAAFACAASVSVQSLTPGTTVVANTLVTFKMASTGFFAQFYQL